VKEKEMEKSMINLLKSEFYKLKKSKGFYILLALCVVFPVILAFAYKGVAATAAAGNPDMQDILVMSRQFSGAWFTGNALSMEGMAIHSLIIAIFVSIFVAMEFNHGTMKNIVSKGFNRTQVYFSKFLTATTAALVMLITFMIASTIIGTILWGFDSQGIASLGNFMTLFLTQGFLIVAYTAVFVFVAMSLRSNGASIGVNICLVILVGTLLEAVNLLFHNNVNLLNYWIGGNISNLTTLNPSSSDVLRGVIVAGVYTVVATAAGFTLFKKQDIK
jgi:ABC-2 type transport system permease protein